jgi:hypothetical protein
LRRFSLHRYRLAISLPNEAAAIRTFPVARAAVW